jgi:hypothetical protein
MKFATKKQAVKQPAATKAVKKAAAAPATAGQNKLKKMIAAREGEPVNVELIIALVLQDLTDLVNVDESANPPTVSPDDLFTLTFDDPKVGLSNEQMPFFKTNLAAALPEAAEDIALIDDNASLQISQVDDLVRASLAHAGVNVG